MNAKKGKKQNLSNNTAKELALIVMALLIKGRERKWLENLTKRGTGARTSLKKRREFLDSVGIHIKVTRKDPAMAPNRYNPVVWILEKPDALVQKWVDYCFEHSTILNQHANEKQVVLQALLQSWTAYKSILDAWIQEMIEGNTLLSQQVFNTLPILSLAVKNNPILLVGYPLYLSQNTRQPIHPKFSEQFKKWAYTALTSKGSVDMMKSFLWGMFHSVGFEHFEDLSSMIGVIVDTANPHQRSRDYIHLLMDLLQQTKEPQSSSLSYFKAEGFFLYLLALPYEWILNNYKNLVFNFQNPDEFDKRKEYLTNALSGIISYFLSCNSGEVDLTKPIFVGQKGEDSRFVSLFSVHGTKNLPKSKLEPVSNDV